MWQAFWATFALVFLAELGDKTQLATMMLAGRAERPGLVFLAAAAALVLSSLVAVVAGTLLARVIPPMAIRVVAGCLFLVLGVLLLMDRF